MTISRLLTRAPVILASELLLLDMPVIAGNRVNDDHRRKHDAAHAPNHDKIRVRSSEQALTRPLHCNPDEQGNAGKNFVEHQPPVPADKHIAGEDHNDASDGSAPDVQLV